LTQDQKKQKKKPMSNKQQTAVEWLVSQVEDYFCLLPIDIIEQAKAIEKEQIEYFFLWFRENGERFIEFKYSVEKMIEQYYKETYGE